MTKINTIDMVYNIPYNNSYLPTNTGTLTNVNQNNPTYNLTTITTATTQLMYTNSGKRYFDFNGTTRSIRSSASLPYTKWTNIQFECEFILRNKKRHILYSMSPTNVTNNELNAVFEIYINSLTNSIVVELANKTFTCNYVFENNIEYNILVTLILGKGLFVNINGESVSSFDPVSVGLALDLIPIASYYHFVGHYSASGTMADVGLNGYMTNIHSSFMGSIIHRTHQDYTTSPYSKLIHFNLLNDSVNLGQNYNSKFDVVNSVYADFQYVNMANSYKVESAIKFVVGDSYYVTFGLDIKGDLTNVLLFSNDQYEVRLNGVGTNVNPEPMVVLLPEPMVVLLPETKSALDFESGIIDKIGNTVWSKTGTGDVTNVNKIFGSNSFETKALGDSLYTNSNVITGGSTPFTIEFYALIKGGQVVDNLPLFNKSSNSVGKGQGLYLSNNHNLEYYRSSAIGAYIDVYGKSKVLLNEINKFNVTYDGASIRVFLNDNLDIVGGVSSGLINTDLPYKFLNNVIPSLGNNSSYTLGIIDNINIHDGIATKVRDPDPYEEYLVVDLAFDGENNSTKIVDNGTLKSNWSNDGFMSPPQIKFNEIFDASVLYLNGRQNIKSNIPIIFDSGEDFTISFDFLRLPSTIEYITILTTNTKDYSNTGEIYSIGAYTMYYPNQSALYFRNKFALVSETKFDIITKKYSIISNTDIIDNVKYKVDIIRKNGKCDLYINNIYDSTSYDFNGRLNFGSICIGTAAWSERFNYSVGFNGYIKNFKIYKGIAVIPENPTGKIQLDFDNNVIDKYNNSTWTNNGVTFDQVNSVKGHAAYFSNSTSTTSSLTQIDFSNHTFELDINPSGVPTHSIPLAVNGHYLYVYIRPTSFAVELYNSGGWINGYGHSCNFVPNQYNNIKLVFKNNLICFFVNGNIIGMSPNDLSTYNVNQSIIIGRPSTGSYPFTGYIDNFKSFNTSEVVIDKPAVHLPLETNATNIGFTPLTINSVGSPTYTTIDGKKCIKFEQGKYLTINSNNIFNLGTSSDFYIELDFYVNSSNLRQYLISSVKSWDTPKYTSYVRIDENNKLSFTIVNDSVINMQVISTKIVTPNLFHTIVMKRKGGLVEISVNDDSYIKVDISYPITFMESGTSLGYSVGDVVSLNGYMSNFKMFVGTSEIPETHNDKKVLDLDFKPSRKSYLFKDNNKCVIHPVNITQRDYQNSQYCCAFNGVDQYLQLGKNDLLNFGNDDFVINIKFLPRSNSPLYGSLISNILNSSMSFLMVLSNGSIGCRMSSNPIVFDGAKNKVIYDIINELIFIQENKNIKIFLNDIIIYEGISLGEFNLNYGGNTFIGNNGWDGNNGFFKGTIFSIKVLRNTTDLTLLEGEVTQTTSFDYKLINTETLDEQIIQSTNKTPNILLERNSTSINLTVDEDSVSILKGDWIPEATNFEIFPEYREHIKPDIAVYNQKPMGDVSYIIPEIDYSPIEAEEVDGMDTITEIQYIDSGDYTIDGFTEGHPNAKYRIINRLNNMVIVSGSDNYYFEGISELYLSNYYVDLYELGIKYQLEDHKMEKGNITYYLNTTLNACVGADYRVRLMRRMDGRVIGEYEFKDGFCTVSNLDRSVAYDAILFDKTNKYESVTMSNRIPLAVE